MKKILSALFLVALIVGTVFILSGSKYYTNEGQIFGTTYHITYAGTNDLDKEIRAELQRVDDALSMFNKQSVLSKFNRNEKYDVSNARFNDVVRLSLQLSRETDGAFDITVAPLVNEWGFGFKHRERINASKIDSLRAFCWIRQTFLRRKSIEQTRFARHHRLWCGGERLRRRLRGTFAFFQRLHQLYGGDRWRGCCEREERKRQEVGDWYQQTGG